ncbi:MAG: glycoside hydrolase family 97 catalytic domain-containing protein [Paludibacter sp.]
MKKHVFATICLSFGFLSVFAVSQKLVLNSPDAKLSIEAEVNAQGHAVYLVKKNHAVVIQQSVLGLITDNDDFTGGVMISQISPVSKMKETYNTPAEKRVNRTYTANYASLKLLNSNKKELTIEFKATNEGVAFRYVLTSEKPIAVKSEKTSFKFAISTKAWLHPHANVKEGWCETQPSYEEQYEYDIPVGTTAPEVAGWSFPALFKTTDNWVLITEAGLTPDYVGTRLAQQSPEGEYSIAFPQKGETTHSDDPEYPVSKNIISAWRVIIVGTLATVVESQMVTDLSLPVDPKADFSWVKTGIASWSWGVLHDDYTTYPVQKQFIDYASEMKWDYCLIDADWDRKIGYDKIQELADYAKTKKVGLILWYNSSGAWNTTVYSPKNALVERDARRKEFERIHKMGIAGVKVDFWPGDGQSAIQYYYDMMKDAADFHLLVNFHGTTVPRGWSRTFPNLVSMEAVRGFEFTTFDQKDTDKAPKHLTMIPYARNVVGPMDFTPVCFGEITGKNRKTSNGMEIALTVILQSGVQHFVTIPESMAKQPAYVIDFMRNLPRHWDDIKFIDGFPGKYVVLARKSGEKWYLAGINSQTETQKLTIDLSPFKTDLKAVSLITDGDTNRSFVQNKIDISTHKLEVEIKPNGGFVVVL